ncbi:MAG: GNAT family N-acetyltransferase [Paenibacillus macerans]|uniref:Acetyltransferase domain protein n=1 Tax=Paenibacillus macerans TaxID=44252 RepID=A0A090Y9E2_PAEMA|nr:GNAT family N-acetyltransferase [Paenibacillus macerans]KFM95398.1 acetyltransferase domain protein [Paenibacillus macerans]MBS5912747.1 GNAT family N-acetyltransferase [Paenibacillus macerans]MCY7562422.1 GNAT family N-acetyltransferase [Paenibacillus macerans]MDU5949181.1 GNAT family N-acetyltransferase [Paenibacillus macerans]MDU7474493.1 GNAT family N-acetyltransferase [Paenibacillus macerans]
MTHTFTWDDVAALQKNVEQRDGISLKLNWDTLLAGKEDDGVHLAGFRDGKLVAFLGKYSFGGSLEICGMVHPDYRRQGIFTGLLERALDAPTRQAHAKILLNAPGDSQTGKRFLDSVRCRFAFSEYQMKLEAPGFAGEHAARTNDSDVVSVSLASAGEAGKADDVLISLAPAGEGDKAILQQLDSEGFKMEPEEARRFYEEMSPAELAQNELILLGGEPAGKIRVSRHEGEAWIYGFVVDARLRGQGIGSAALRHVIKREQAAGYDVWLEVALDNPNAKKLYENVGFRVQRSQDYYEYARA